MPLRKSPSLHKETKKLGPKKLLSTESNQTAAQISAVIDATPESSLLKKAILEKYPQAKNFLDALTEQTLSEFNVFQINHLTYTISDIIKTLMPDMEMTQMISRKAALILASRIYNIPLLEKAGEAYDFFHDDHGNGYFPKLVYAWILTKPKDKRYKSSKALMAELKRDVQEALKATSAFNTPLAFTRIVVKDPPIINLFGETDFNAIILGAYKVFKGNGHSSSNFLALARISKGIHGESILTEALEAMRSSKKFSRIPPGEILAWAEEQYNRNHGISYPSHEEIRNAYLSSKSSS